jgi:hypothetical protein
VRPEGKISNVWWLHLHMSPITAVPLSVNRDLKASTYREGRGGGRCL